MIGTHKNILRLLILIIPCVMNRTQGCEEPRKGGCSNDSQSHDNGTVCGLNATFCDFSDTSGLCYYQQGCADPGMLKWAFTNGYAISKQAWLGSCGVGYYYSVLESPWINLTSRWCLKFTYRIEAPAGLDVFLERRGQVIPLLLRADNFDDQEISVQQEHDQQGLGKVIFRAFGGRNTDGEVKINDVFVVSGRCQDADAVPGDRMAHCVAPTTLVPPSHRDFTESAWLIQASREDRVVEETQGSIIFPILQVMLSLLGVVMVLTAVVFVVWKKKMTSWRLSHPQVECDYPIDEYISLKRKVTTAIYAGYPADDYIPPSPMNSMRRWEPDNASAVTPSVSTILSSSLSSIVETKLPTPSEVTTETKKSKQNITFELDEKEDQV